MAEIKLFTKNDCGKCDYVIERIPEGMDVEIVNVDTVDGLAEGAFYQVLNRTFPILVIDHIITAEGSINSVKALKEISESK